MDNSELLPYLGLMRKAGSLVCGAEDVSAACLGGKGRVALLARDASNHTVRWIGESCEHKQVPILTLDCDKNDLGGALGIGECAAAAVCDTGFALSLAKKMALPELIAQLEQRAAREKKRKAKKLAGKGKTDTSKRGKNV